MNIDPNARPYTYKYEPTDIPTWIFSHTATFRVTRGRCTALCTSYEVRMQRMRTSVVAHAHMRAPALNANPRKPRWIRDSRPNAGVTHAGTRFPDVLYTAHAGTNVRKLSAHAHGQTRSRMMHAGTGVPVLNARGHTRSCT